MAIDIGLIAYNAYCEKLISDDCDLLKWGEMGKQEQDAWRHAACVVLEYIREERKRCIEEDQQFGIDNHPDNDEEFVDSPNTFTKFLKREANESGVFCNYCPCKDCQKGTAYTSHAQTVNGDWICNVCYQYDLCTASDAVKVECEVPCENKDCIHRPKLISDWIK